MSLLSIRGVAKQFGQVQVLRDVSMEIAAGEFLTVLGESGSGKTTLLRLLAGFERPDRGEIWMDDERLDPLPPNRRGVNTVFQHYALFPHLSVFENVAYGLRARKIPKEEIAPRVGKALAQVKMSELAGRRPTELSGGQQQRVALARALVNHPKALLLDEPLGALDLKLRQAMQVELKRIQREVGITFVYVTHDQNEALTMSDRIAVMNDGIIEHLGPPREIYEHPATRFVAGFIGTSNLLTGSLAQVTGGQGVIEVSADERIIVPAGRSGLTAGQQVELTVRPEKIELATGPGTAGGCALRGTVTEVVYLGTSTSFSVATTTGADVVVFQQNSASAATPVSRGDEVWLTWDPQHSYPIG